MTEPSMPNETAGTAVIALGGNALAPSGQRSNVYDQFRHTRASLGPIVDLVSAGWNVCVVHGNGPQVGDEMVGVQHRIAGRAHVRGEGSICRDGFDAVAVTK